MLSWDREPLLLEFAPVYVRRRSDKPPSRGFVAFHFAPLDRLRPHFLNFGYLSVMCDSQRVEQAIKDYQSGKNREENARLIYDCYRPMLIGFFAKRGFPWDLRRDLTHDVFVRVFTHIAKFRGEGPFGAWLFKIANSIRNEHLRGQMTEKRKGQTISLDSRGDDCENQSFPLDFSDRSPISKPLDAALLDKERMRSLDDALMKLPEQMRKCWIFRERQELSYKEIAVAMGGISVETVKAHLRQARARLKAILAPE